MFWSEASMQKRAGERRTDEVIELPQFLFGCQRRWSKCLCGCLERVGMASHTCPSSARTICRSGFPGVVAWSQSLAALCLVRKVGRSQSYTQGRV